MRNSHLCRCLSLLACLPLATSSLASEPRPALLPGAMTVTAPPASASDATLVVRDYDLRELLRSLAGRDADSAPGDARMIAPLLQPLADSLVRVQTDQITLRASEGNHRRIAELLQLWQQHGMQQIVVELRFLAISASVLESAGMGNMILQTEPAASAGSPLEPPTPAGPLELPTGAGVKLITSRRVTTEHVPVLLETLDTEQIRRLLTGAQGDARANILQAPKVTTFNGQSAVIADVTQRPFVVGSDTSIDPPKPQVCVLAEGTTINYRATVSATSQRVRLDCQLQFDEIAAVETADLGLADGEPMRVQIPQARSQTIAFAADLGPGQSLLVGGTASAGSKRPTAKSGLVARLGWGGHAKEPQQLYVLISPRVLDLTKI